MIVYLHGFNSTGNSSKGQTLKHTLKQTLPSVPFFTPTYHYNPDIAITVLMQEINEQLLRHKLKQPEMIIGSSLGGFYGQYIARQFNNIKLVLINPALGPVDTLQHHLGENENFYTGERYILQKEHLEALKKYDIEKVCSDNVSTLLLVDKADEIIDYRFAVEKYKHCAEMILYEKGDHQFQHLMESIAKILELYNT